MNWFLKVVIYTSVLHSTHGVMEDDFRYSTILAPSFIVLFLATVGHFADQWVLPRWGNPVSSICGGSFIAGVLWVTQFFFPGSEVQWWGALFIGGILGAVEYRMHKDLLHAKSDGS
ncbi:DUF2512 family protein [Paludifilum halophilum]|nr:DUF2512 family protein [Paludifilum halophilum]